MAAQWENVEHTHDMGCCVVSENTISMGTIADTDKHSRELVFGIVDEGVLGSVTTKLNLYNELVALYEKIKTCKHITDENKFMMMLDVIREIKDINR